MQLWTRSCTFHLMMGAGAFEQFAARKTLEAAAPLSGRLVTESESIDHAFEAIGNAWTLERFGGPFLVSLAPQALPAISLTFVQDRNANTGAANPADLGGGALDLHLIYEGLSRAAVDGVLAGATTAAGDVFFSVWHPQIVALRASLELPRHPAQIVVSRDGHLDLDRTLLFNVPEVPVFVLAGDLCREQCERSIGKRPWVTVIPIDHGDVTAALKMLRAHGVHRISAIGGRSTATALIDAGVVSDLYLTTTNSDAGERKTPVYVGHRNVGRELVIRKRSEGTDVPIVFEHFRLSVSS